MCVEKRVTGFCFTILFIGIIYAAVAAFSIRNQINIGGGDKEVVIWDDGMERTHEDGVYCYRHTLPLEDMSEKVIVYNTVHMYLEVLIDGETVYELKTGEDSMIKTPGFCWNTISLSADDAGKEIVFLVTPVYSDSTPKGSFYYGTYREIERRILAERVLRLVLSGTIALAGIAMFFYGFFVVKRGQDSEAIIQFAIFATMLGIWSVIETQVPDWLFPCNMIIVVVSHLMLMMLPIPFMLFLRHMYHNKESKLWSICCYMNCAVITLRVTLQIIGVYDLRETLLLTHICFLLFVSVIIVMTIHEIAKHGFVGQVKLNSVCVLVILASTILELAIYRFGNMSTPLGSIGFLFYIAVMGIVNVRKTHELMNQARESALYRRLAYTDELTGLLNRTAFREDLEKRMEPEQTAGGENILPTVVYMLDLNDLKKCNDTYGHDYGDQYIRMAADAIKKIFEEEGKCYRIGGDEFCVWEPYISQDMINEKLSLFEQEIQVLNSKGFVVTVGIAVGYAVYAKSEDGCGLYSTVKRADAMMYARKQAYKKSVGA